MKLIKLTDAKGQTYGGTKWKVGTTHTLPSTDNPELCSKDVLHAYKNINLALLLNPIHANFENPCIYEIEAEIATEDWDKVGCFSQKVLRRLPQPDWYKNQPIKNHVLISFAILRAESVLKHFEDKHPTDNGPRQVIEAAKAYLANSSALATVRAAAATVRAAAATVRAADDAYASSPDAAACAAYAAACAACVADAAIAAAAADVVYVAYAAAYAAIYAAAAAIAAADTDAAAAAADADTAAATQLEENDATSQEKKKEKK